MGDDAVSEGTGLGIIATVILIALLVGCNMQFNADCSAHGGAHTTYPYKSWPECWDAEGRRVFW